MAVRWLSGNDALLTYRPGVRLPSFWLLVLGPPVPVPYVVIVYRTIAYLSIVLA